VADIIDTIKISSTAVIKKILACTSGEMQWLAVGEAHSFGDMLVPESEEFFAFEEETSRFELAAFIKKLPPFFRVGGEKRVEQFPARLF
jgi:hypothetical protein